MEPMMSLPNWMPSWMDEHDWEQLEAAGWTAERVEALKRTPAQEAIQQEFLNRAKQALDTANTTALGFLQANPGISTIDLAKRLNHGANTIGLVMAIYEEARKTGQVRDTAKDLLIRKINSNFPYGWFSGDKVSPAVKLGSWRYHFCDSIDKRVMARAVKDIVYHLTVESPPPEGWKPQPQNDPLIDELFDRYWPVEEDDAESSQ